jgi:monofunctional biosynthetic peptidoglycan transglycosylase
MNPPVTPLMVQRYFESKKEGDKKKIVLDWKSLNEISPAMPLAAITAEDQKFNEHYGFDFEAIKKAFKYNERKKGNRLKGASTISQQTAKNVFLFPDRSWIRKGLEVYFTLLIELFWSKHRIMEVYLNVIETGDGIYGVEAAARKYFRKPAKDLSIHEAALIAAVLPNPRVWSPAKPSPYILKKKKWIVRKMAFAKLPL